MASAGRFRQRLTFLGILLLGEGSPAWGIRNIDDLDQGQGESLARENDRKLVLLVTRHGVSCANLASHWISGFKSLSHGFIKDPPLAHFGIEESKAGGKGIRSWLKGKGWHLDVVVASVLARAIQTAMFQYFSPEEPVAAPKVWSLPHLRENGHGLDNQAKKVEDQAEYFQTAGDDEQDVEVDTTWVPKGKARDSKGNWKKFLEFLGDEFLPTSQSEIWQQAEKGRDQPIVMGVVTHSNLMNKDPLKSLCKEKYHDIDGTRKAYNNQVLAITYTVKHTDDGYEFEDDGTCEVVTEGTNIAHEEDGSTMKPICERDMGEQCTSIMSAKPKTLEQMQHDARLELGKFLQRMAATGVSKEGVHNPEALEQFSQELALRQLNIRSLTETTCWDGKPAPTIKAET